MGPKKGTEDTVGDSDHKVRDEGENDVKYICRDGQGLQQGIGIDLKQDFGQEFGGKQDQQGRDQRLGQQAEICEQGSEECVLGRQHPLEPGHEQITHKQAVYHQGNIVANKHGGNEFGWFLGKSRQDFRQNTRLFFFDFNVNLVGGDKGDLHTRKKGRERKGQDNYGNSGFHGYSLF